MKWFYVVVVLMNQSGTQSMVAMPDEATCEAVRALNGRGECLAKKDAPALSDYSRPVVCLEGPDRCDLIIDCHPGPHGDVCDEERR